VCLSVVLRCVQIWRINDLLYMPEQEALAELEAHRWVWVAFMSGWVRGIWAMLRQDKPCTSCMG